MTAFIWPGTVLVITGMVSFAALKGWRGWLDLKRYEIAAERSQPDAPDPSSGIRIEMADIKERLRRLEAIATGVEL